MKTVLLIDDEPSFGELITPFLADAGWRVLMANNGQRGLSMAWQERPDVVICDLHMPQHNGFQVCRALRQRTDLLPHVRIIMTTGSSYATDRRNAQEAGADEYLVKPVRPEVLLALLSDLVTGERPVRATETSRMLRVAAQVPPTAAFEATPQDQQPGGPPRLRFWGVRGSIPCPGLPTVHYGGNTSCVEVRADGEIIILDAGSGIRPLGQLLAGEYQDRPLSVTVLISHTHWDHIQGFPFFGPAYNPKNHLRVLGFEGARKGFDIALSSQMESSYFPIGLSQMPGNIRVQELRELNFSIGAVQVEAAFLNHPGICMGYRLYTSAGSIAYLPDNEPYQRLRSLHEATGGRMEAMSYATGQDQKLIQFIEESDVLVIDSQYDEAEYRSHVGWGHGCVDDVVALAIIARVKQLFLFHHDPDHDDARITQMTDWARELVRMHGAQLKVDAAREGVEVVLSTATQAPGLTMVT